MAAIGVESQEMPRWLTTPLAASAASFHPSNAAIATGRTSGPSTSLNLMTSPPHHLRADTYGYSIRRPLAALGYLNSPRFPHTMVVLAHKPSPRAERPVFSLPVPPHSLPVV